MVSLENILRKGVQYVRNTAIMAVAGYIMFFNTSKAQDISGRVVNNGSGVEAGVDCHMTIDGNYALFTAPSDDNGFFVANSTTDVKDPTETENIGGIRYMPGARLNLNLNSYSNVKISIVDLLGQERDVINQEMSGENNIQLDMRDYASGLYIIKTEIDGKIYANKILKTDGFFNYGKIEQQIEGRKEQSMNKNNQGWLRKGDSDITLDSITVKGNGIQTKTVPYGWIITGNTDVGEIEADSAYVTISGRVYKLMKWTEQNNGIEGAIVTVGNQIATSGANGQYSLIVPSGINNVNITHPQTWERNTVIKTEKDTTMDLDVLDTLNFSSNLMTFYNSIFGRNAPGLAYQTNRWKEPPIFYIVADTTQEPGRSRALKQIEKINQVLKPAYTTPLYPNSFLENPQIEIGQNPPPIWTPGYYIIEWGEISGAEGLTGCKVDTTKGEIYSSHTKYNSQINSQSLERITVKELSTGMSYNLRDDQIPSIWNVSVLFENRNFTDNDKKMILFNYGRIGRNTKPDSNNNFWE